MLVTIPRDDDKLFQGPVIKVDNGYWIPPAQTHWGPWCRFPPTLDNTPLCIAWTVSWIWICHLIKSPCKDSCGQRRLPTTPRTNQCHFQIKLLNKNMSWELHTRETFQCTCTFWRWRGKKKKEKSISWKWLATHLWLLRRWGENAFDVLTCLSLPFQGHLLCCPFSLRCNLLPSSENRNKLLWYSISFM